MINKKNILTAWSLIIFCISIAAAQRIRPVIRFGIISDIQYCDCETGGSRYYRNSLHKLALNDREVLSTVEKYSCVKALIAGHHHGGAFCYAAAYPA
jgi:hypothetical protein